MKTQNRIRHRNHSLIILKVRNLYPSQQYSSEI